MSQLHDSAVFQALPRPTVLLDTDLVIRAVNSAYLTATARDADELVNRSMFDAFPDSPEDPDADGVANLSRSLERAARTRRPDNMLIQRYDIQETTSGRWVRRHWSPVNTPVVEDDRVVALLHQVEDVTRLEDLRSMIAGCRGLLDDGPLTDERAHILTDAARAFVTSAADYHAMAAEIMQLRRAMSSRSTIEQAKGIIMGERRCTPDAAFDVLVRLSQDTQVRVADVAAALVYRAQGPASQGEV